MRKLVRWFRVTIYSFIGNKMIGEAKTPVFCGGWTILTKKTIVGKNVSFNGMKIKGNGKVFIGNNFHSGSECEIITQNHNFEGNKIPYDDTYIIKDVVIGDNVWLGNRVMILPGVKIEEGAIIQAGSVVVSNIPCCAIAGGHPAKVFSSRNKEHYFALKAQDLEH